MKRNVQLYRKKYNLAKSGFYLGNISFDKLRRLQNQKSFNRTKKSILY